MTHARLSWGCSGESLKLAWPDGGFAYIASLMYKFRSCLAGMVGWHSLHHYCTIIRGSWIWGNDLIRVHGGWTHAGMARGSSDAAGMPALRSASVKRHHFRFADVTHLAPSAEVTRCGRLPFSCCRCSRAARPACCCGGGGDWDWSCGRWWGGKRPPAAASCPCRTPGSGACGCCCRSATGLCLQAQALAAPGSCGQTQQLRFQRDDCAPGKRHLTHLAAVTVERARGPCPELSMKPCMPPHATWETIVHCWQTIRKRVCGEYLAASCWSNLGISGVRPLRRTCSSSLRPALCSSAAMPATSLACAWSAAASLLQVASHVTTPHRNHHSLQHQ